MLKIDAVSKVVLVRNLLLRICTFAAIPTVLFAATTKLAGPVTSGSPNQPFGVRRPVTAADRTLIQSYRSKKPTVLTTFSKPDDIQSGWTFLQDDVASLKSCRKNGNVETSSAGLKFKTLVATDCHAHWSTGSIVTRAQYSYGFFEITMKIADIAGMNNAFWMTSQDHYEIDVGEVQYPNYSHIGLQYWPVTKDQKHAGVGFAAKFTDNLSSDFHDYGVLWTPKELIFEVDGNPVAALSTNDSIKGPVNLMLSNALADWAGTVPAHPEGHGMAVKSLRIVELAPGQP